MRDARIAARWIESDRSPAHQSSRRGGKGGLRERDLDRRHQLLRFDLQHSGSCLDELLDRNLHVENIPRYPNTMIELLCYPITGANMKTLSLRLPDEQAAALEAIAQADEVSVSETIRQAIDSQINERRDDAEFQKRLRVAMERNQKALELLAK